MALIFKRHYQDLEQAAYDVRLAYQMRSEIKKRRAEKSQRPYASPEPIMREPELRQAAPKKPPADPSLATSGVVTVVTGLPRSGTSMLMQMLQAGGMPVLTDQIRQSDEDNPLGYFEYETAKRLQTDRTWVGKSVDKAVKVVVQLLPYLPRNFQYQVLLIHRNLNEVLQSQEVMLKRQDKQGTQLSPAALKNVFSRQLDRVIHWTRKAPHIRLLELDYSAIIGDSGAAAAQIQEFLETSLEIDKMRAAVRPSLYRQRGS